MLNRLTFDSEIFPNYYLAMLLADDDRSVAFEMYDGKPLDRRGLQQFLECGAEIITFNGENFDIPLARMALAGASTQEIYEAANEIIAKRMRHWQFEKTRNLAPLQVNHVDLIEVAPGQASLKLYAGRLHAKRMQDLPYPPGHIVLPSQRADVRRYCKNDCRNTRGLADDLAQQLDLRRHMTSELAGELVQSGLAHLMPPADLRSRSDAQIAEAVLKQRVFLATGAIPRKRPATETEFFYEAPDHINFETEQLQQVLKTVCSAQMKLGDTGHVIMPAEIKNLLITIGGTSYQLGLGGLHSQESEVSHYADDETDLEDIDVVSYYPWLILNVGMYPVSMGPTFLREYRRILDERVAAKRAKQKAKDGSLKIVLNGTFGKTSSQYSIFYNPKMMIRTTLTGQLSILMLIETLETRGIPVVSANTDGIVVKCPKSMLALRDEIVTWWEGVTNLQTEKTAYRSIHSRDVNNYIAIKPDGSVKTKGVFAPPGLAKNPQNQVCVDAVVAYLTNGVPVDQSIRACTDIRKFVTVRRVKGGAVKDGQLLGKAIRWYYAAGALGVIVDGESGNTVARSAKAKPIMDLPESFPNDVDYDWYVQEANELLMDVGVLPRPRRVPLPRRNTKAWKELLQQGLVEIDDYDKPRWAVRYDEIPKLYRV